MSGSRLPLVIAIALALFLVAACTGTTVITTAAPGPVERVGSEADPESPNTPEAAPESPNHGVAPPIDPEARAASPSLDATSTSSATDPGPGQSVASEDPAPSSPLAFSPPDDADDAGNADDADDAADADDADDADDAGDAGEEPVPAGWDRHDAGGYEISLPSDWVILHRHRDLDRIAGAAEDNGTPLPSTSINEFRRVLGSEGALIGVDASGDNLVAVRFFGPASDLAEHERITDADGI